MVNRGTSLMVSKWTNLMVMKNTCRTNLIEKKYYSANDNEIYKLRDDTRLMVTK